MAISNSIVLLILGVMATLFSIALDTLGTATFYTSYVRKHGTVERKTNNVIPFIMEYRICKKHLAKFFNIQFPGLRQTISEDSSLGPSALLPVNRRMCLNDQGLRTEQLISPTRSYSRREQIAPTRKACYSPLFVILFVIYTVYIPCISQVFISVVRSFSRPHT
ncbi:hypothetical protein RND71_042080 [Anisodus tanguticus]|uniref:Uncharacterized protein n=1 Tax=Anisodus tanguticus TaxID=243964 RepID=A0AAE1QRW4_9SOLA|nr:hypothetical protein RND71_042080 [Anisodus tanguticus]